MDIKALVDEMTLEEKASLTSGATNWLTKAVERLGIVSVRMADGPHGIRLQEDGEKTAQPATCFPTGCLSAASFDTELVKEMGMALGRAAKSSGIHVLLGPGVNIKRSPLCGRNFEYFSEDPYVSGEIGAAFVEGIQSQGVGASLKHYFANNQEHRRMDGSSEVDERTLREIYLSAFERIVKKSNPWTVMASYNKINGIHATENRQYLTDVLRAEWGYDGVVVSDWGAVHNRSHALAAGTDLTMPTATDTDLEIVRDVLAGDLEESHLNQACVNILTLISKIQMNESIAEVNHEADYMLAKKVAAESIILLKNEAELLPLDVSKTKIAFIGEFAKNPRYQGGGSSHINPNKLVSAYEVAQEQTDISYAQGYDNQNLEVDPILIEEAVKIAQKADVAVIFAGLPESLESEGFDRHHLNLPASHNRLIEAVCQVQSNTVVVLHNGAPVEMPWVQSPKAILETYLGGQAVGEAVVDILLGKINPSGALPESFPIKLEDNPSYLYFRGENGVTHYGERNFVGYRYYESKKMPVLYPFGHGLSYTTFEFSDLIVEEKSATIQVVNTGTRAGKVIVQLYIAPPIGEIIRPIRELRAFEKITLEAGEGKIVRFELDERMFSYWNTEASDWAIEEGEYGIQIGRSASNIILEEKLFVAGTNFERKIIYTPNTIIAEFKLHPFGAKIWSDNFKNILYGMAKAGMIPEARLAQIDQIEEHSMNHLLNQPIALLANFVPEIGVNGLLEILEKMNDTGEGEV